MQNVSFFPRLYRERMTQIEAKLDEVRSGKATEYLQPLEELQENMRVRLDVAKVLRDFRMNNAQCKLEAEELAAQQNFEVNFEHDPSDIFNMDLDL